MKIRATRTFKNDIGMVRRGAEVDIRDVYAKSLIDRGIAVAVTEAADESPTEPKQKPHAGRNPKGKPRAGAVKAEA